MSLTEIPGIVDELRSSYESGLTRTLKFRISQLRALNEMLEKEETVITKALYKDLRKPYTECVITELIPTKNAIADMILNLEEFMNPRIAHKPLALAGDVCEVRRVPLGVVLIIVPWNYPICLSLVPLVGAIGGGNTSVLKLSEIAPHTSAALAQIIPKYLDERVVRVVLGAIPESTLLLQQKFDLLFYTGNTNVGRIVMQAAVKHIVPVVLELGGKCPVIIDSTVDPAIAARRIAWGKLNNCGQTCVAPDYILVEKSIAPHFVKELKLAIIEMIGNTPQTSSSYGRIVSSNHFKRLEKLLNAQLAVPGTKVAYGGQSDASDLFIHPTILTGISTDAAENPIMSEELFGPILPIIEIENIKQGIDYAKKNHPNPLAVYCFSRVRSVIEEVFAEVNAGGAVANDVVIHVGCDDIPFGGVGSSGLGSYHGANSFNTFTREQSILIRTVAHDHANTLRYVNVSGNAKSFAFKIVKFAVQQGIPSDFILILNSILNRLGGIRKILLLFAIFTCGFYLGRRF
ncbi:Aldehyde/histidinol dehydrogenase [Globomyces pollinis-pini]|nr:Aldehyde/histidinol dehydrogenase [Globomyces pollinis-pini]